METTNNPCRFQTVQPCPAGRGRNIDDFGQSGLAQLPVELQSAENAQISRVKAGPFHVVQTSIPVVLAEFRHFAARRHP